jgi:hypothetical protein
MMFKVRAASAEEYFGFDPGREDALRELDAVSVRRRPPCHAGSCNLQALAEMVAAIAAGLESGHLVAR